MPSFSVIIPLYNKENYITDTLNSVLGQTFTDFEIIVINDASTDNSLAVAEAVKDERIRFINHPVNKGLSAARNTGIKNASSDYVTFIDADDLWKSEFLEKVYLLINQHPECSIYGTRYEEIYPGNLILDIGVSLENLKNEMGTINFFSTGLNKPAFCSSCLCLKKEVFDKSGYYDESITFGEDIDFYIRINYDFKLAYYNESLASYLIYYQNQMTGAGLKNKKVPDFDKYEYMTQNRPDIKRYLDFQRYIIAKTYRLSGDMTNYKKTMKGITMSSLNYKQQLLLKAPLFVVKTISLLKKMLLKKGVVVNSYN